MSVQSEIDRIITAVGNAYSKVSEKGGIVPASQTVANLATAIGSIPAGGRPSLHSKSVMYTSNGTSTITPDEGYDGLSSVDVMVNVASGGVGGAGFSVTFPVAGSNNYLNWSNFSLAYILKADGNILEITDYTTIAGETIDEVVLFTAGRRGGYWGLKFTFNGKVTLYHPAASADDLQFVSRKYADTTVENLYGVSIHSGQFFIPNSDLTITSISAYDTDF